MNQSGSDRRLFRFQAIALWIGVCTAWVASAVAHAQGGAHWAMSPYRTKVVVLLDVPQGAKTVLQSALPRHLTQRTTAAIGPLWDLDIVKLDAVEAHRLTESFDELPSEVVTRLSNDCDKLVLVSVFTEGDGYRLKLKAFDTLLQTWTATFEYEQGSLHDVPETVFWALREAFAPVAYFKLIPDEEQHVNLFWKGSELPIKQHAGEWVKPGEVLLPVLRRTNRDGTAIENGVQQVPWTYLQIGADEPDRAKAKVFSHSKRPFGGRRRGTVEQNAILSRGPLRPVVVQLQSRTNNDLPLAGFDVYRQVPGQDETTWVGKSSLQGEVQIAPTTLPLEMLFVKSGSQVVAKLPVAFSSDRSVAVPLVDDPVRLEAEAKINLVREQLVDLVARRTILAARVRQQIDDGKLDEAAKLVGQLEEMPGPAQFNQMLVKHEQLSRSPHPVVQKRIEKMFADTRVVLGHFLDPRLATDLRNELSEAQKPATQ